MVVAQLAERSLPTPEIRGSNPDIGNISNIFICQLLSRKDENKEKEAGNGPLKKILNVCCGASLRCISRKQELIGMSLNIFA